MHVHKYVLLHLIYIHPGSKELIILCKWPEEGIFKFLSPSSKWQSRLISMKIYLCENDQFSLDLFPKVKKNLLMRFQLMIHLDNVNKIKKYIKYFFKIPEMNFYKQISFAYVLLSE